MHFAGLSTIFLSALILTGIQGFSVGSPCTHQDSAGTCTWCQDGFYLAAGICLHQNIPGCLEYQPNRNACVAFKSQVRTERRLAASDCVYEDQGVCYRCGNLYYPDPNTASNPCISINDPQCTTSGGIRAFCNVCAAGFYPRNGVCTAQSQNGCLGYRANTNQCLSCQSPRILRAGTCATLNNANCADYRAGPNVCVTCQPGFFSFSGGCKSSNDPNCSVVVALGSLCPFCNSGFYADNTRRVCVSQSQPNCLAFTPNTNTCINCQPNYALATGGCVAANTPNCITNIANSFACDTCASLYYPSAGSCDAITSTDCQTSDGQTDVCQLCANMFYLDAGSCLPFNDPNCGSNVSNDAICAVCNLGSPGIDGLCFI